MDLMTEMLAFLLLGTVSGILSGVLGIGGGTIIVPALAAMFSILNFPETHIMHLAAGTSLAAMIFSSQASFRAHYRRGNFAPKPLIKLLPSIIVGTVCGAILADQMHSDWLRIIFGLFILIMSMRMLFAQRDHIGGKEHGWGLYSLMGSLIGLKAGLLGVGGAALTVPFLTHSQVNMRQAITISSACALVIAICGSITAMFTGASAIDLPKWHTGYVYWPAVVGIAIPSMLTAPRAAYWSTRIPMKILKQCFATLLLIVGLHMLIGL